MGIIIIDPKDAKVFKDAAGVVSIKHEDGTVLASGFSDEADAQRYLDSLKSTVPHVEEEHHGDNPQA